MTGWYLYSVVCELVGLGFFLYGFFLVNYDHGKESLSQSTYTASNDVEARNSHIFKTILVVIDALRYDFVVSNDTHSNLPYLNSLLEKKEACVFPCRVHLPTVTMPRIKAMTVGDSSNFLDIALNFGSSRIKHDNILAQMKRRGLKVVFYGDDTWVKLFPNLFYRERGVPSFFVSDFYEVDDIVTKNAEDELTRDDWDVMILHYLGLDHIGHVEGPKGSKIPAKLREMDDIIEKLHGYLLQWKLSTNETYLLMVSADHGMRDSGGHGGASMPETFVPLVTVGMNCSSDSEISQVDLPVTLASLLGLPIPRESIGKVIPGLVEQLPLFERADMHRRMTKHLMKKYVQVIGPLAPDLEDSFLNAHELLNQNMEKASEIFQSVSHRLSSSLVAFLTKFDIFYLLIGVLISVQATCLPLTTNRLLFGTFFKSLPVAGLAVVLLLVSSYFYGCQSSICDLSKDSILLVCFLTSIVTFNLLHLLQARKLMMGRFISAVSIMENDKFLAFLIVGLFLQMLTTLSTSLIEEEHMYWYFLWTTFLMLLFRKFCSRSSGKYLVALLVSHRILRRLNQTGDQYASSPDIGDWFRIPERKPYLTVFLFIEITLTWWTMGYRNKTQSSQKQRKTISELLLSVDRYLDGMCLLSIFQYRAAVGEVANFWNLSLSDGGVLEIQVFKYLLVGSALLKFMKWLLGKRKMGAWSLIDPCIDVWILVTALVLRSHDVILVGALVVTSKWLRRAIEEEENKEIKLVISHYWLAYIYFFYQGNSNSLATINVTPGYIGQNEYNMFVAGALILINTYSMPILALLLMLNEVRRHRRNAIEPAVRLLLMFINLNVTFYLIVMIIQRHHLFIWSVFSPKLFYVSVYCLIVYPIIIFALCVSERK